MRLFREVKRVLTAPAPRHNKRKRTEAARAGFRLAALQIARRVMRSIFDISNFDFPPCADPDNRQRLHSLHSSSAHHHPASANTTSQHAANADRLSPRL